MWVSLLFYLIQVCSYANSESKNKAIEDFQFIKNSIYKAIDGDKKSFAEIPVEKLLNLMSSNHILIPGKNLKVDINGKKFSKAFVNYAHRTPVEIHIDEVHWQSVVSSSNVLCIVLHEYLSLLGEEDYLYEKSGNSKLCLKLQFATVNFVWQSITNDQAKIDKVFQLNPIGHSHEQLKGNPYAKYRSFFPLESAQTEFFLGYDNDPAQSQIRSQLRCMKHLCERYRLNRCKNPTGFQEKNMLCNYWQEFTPAFNIQCRSIGLNKWCDFSDHNCDNSAFVRQSVYFSCIGPITNSLNE